MISDLMGSELAQAFALESREILISGQSLGCIIQFLESTGQYEEGWCPETDEYSESFCVSNRFRSVSLG